MHQGDTFQSRSGRGPQELFGRMTSAEEEREKSSSVGQPQGELVDYLSAQLNDNENLSYCTNLSHPIDGQDTVETDYPLPETPNDRGSHHTMVGNREIFHRPLVEEESARRCLQRALPEAGEEDDAGEMEIGRTFTDDPRQFTCHSSVTFMS